ncbi:MAG: GNAT family N-acetyltransferase [Pseudomonadota bacterium]
MSEVRLRDAEPGDASVILQMLRDLAEAVGEAEASEARLDDIERDGFGPHRHFETIIAEAEGRAAGMMVIFPTYSTYKGRPCLFVNDLYVAPWARGLGVGRLLMARACRLALIRGCCRVELHVLQDNPARSFYEGIGMVASEERVYVARGQAMEDLAEQ